MILENPIFTEMILPFLFIFVVVFAILQKSKILGEGKEQIDAMAALVIGLLLIAVPQPRSIVVGIMPWLAVGIATIFVFLILYGFVAGDLSEAKMKKGVKDTFLALAAIFTAGVIIYVSGLWEIIYDWLSRGDSQDIWISIVMIVLIIGAVAVVVNSAKKKD